MQAMFFRLASLFLWFAVTPSVIILSTLLISQQKHVDYNQDDYPSFSQFTQNSNLLIEGQFLGVQIDNNRWQAIESFLENTPLEPYSGYLVETSDKYGIDYRLIPAIAMKETSGGTTARAGSFNAWGFENGRTNFESWETAIEIVAKTLKERYIARGLVTPEQIMPVYAPPQIEKGGKWAKDIKFFFSQMDIL